MKKILGPFALSLLLTAPVSAQKIGTIVVAHGGDSAWNVRVSDAAKAANTGGPVEVSFLMGGAARETRFQDVVERLGRAGVSAIVVVPMLVSSHSGHFDQIRYLVGDSLALEETMRHHLEMSGIERPRAGVPLHLARALDAAPELARVLADRALAMSPAPGGQALFLVGHGPNSDEDYAAWMANLRPVADSVKAWTGFRDVRVDLVRDDAPAAVRAEAVLRVREIIALQNLATGKPVVVIPILISEGTVSRDRVPNDLRGTPSLYARTPLLPHPAMVRWIEARVSETVATLAAAR